ncbi:FMO family protein [Abortiporus biennis]
MPNKQSPRVVIIGGGIGGLMAGINLRRTHQYENFTIYEREDDIGGTWKTNTYPGCASDVETHWFSLSTDLNPNWRKSHVLQPDLLAYWKSLAKKYNLWSRIVCNTTVLSAEWDDENQLYRVKLQDVRSKEIREDYANIIISATGIFSTPRYPRIDDIERFKGNSFHSAEWNHDVDLRNKRVAVIGNACSGAQFIPVISEDPTASVVNFCRSPQWVVNTRPPANIGAVKRWIFAHIPFVMRIHRSLIFASQELFYFRYIGADEKGTTKSKVTNNLSKEMKDLAPEKYRNIIIPDFPVGCKRVVFGTTYLKALHRLNIEVTYDPVEKIVEDGIVTKKGTKMDKFDVIIFATGFNTANYPIAIRGRNGLWIQEYYDQKAGPQAYYGTTVPGFPNFFQISGPNTTTGHGSVIFIQEIQFGWAMQLISPILKGQVSSFEPKDEATERYNKILQSKLETGVWSTGCSSWYRDSPTSKIHTNFPGSLTKLWWIMREPIWNDFHVVHGDWWAFRRRAMKVIKTFGVISIVGIFLLAKINPGRLEGVLAAVRPQFDDATLEQVTSYFRIFQSMFNL